jgi:hypothetical protein
MHHTHILMMSVKINVKMVEILCNLIQEQNNQLIQLISTEEHIDFRSLSQLVPSRYEIKKVLQNYCREKLNSTSESKLSSSASPSDDE